MMDQDVRKLHEALDEPDKEKKLSAPERISEEHDPVLHSKLRPHSGPKSYDPKWGKYRNEE